MIRIESAVVSDGGFRMPGNNHTTSTIQAVEGKTALVYDPATSLLGVIEDLPTGVRIVRCVHAARLKEMTLVGDVATKFIAASGLSMAAKPGPRAA